MLFKSPGLRDLLRDIVASDFVIDENGSPIEPPSLSGQAVTIGKGVYRMGIGGLHSSEVSTVHHADEQYMLVDRDVASYYPNIILLCRLYPKHLTEAFLSVYRSIVETRLKAKRDGNSVVANALKIVANGSFGKFGSKYSLLYAPDLMIQVTVTGQLALLMLIESLEADGIEVVSANTDGIVIKCLRSRENDLLRHVTVWEKVTGFETEETQYKALYSRDVNNYIALKKKAATRARAHSHRHQSARTRRTPSAWKQYARGWSTVPRWPRRYASAMTFANLSQCVRYAAVPSRSPTPTTTTR